MTVVNFDGESPGEVDVDLGEFWDVSYRVVGDFDPPEDHRGGPEVWEAPDGADLAELNGEIELLAGDDEPPVPTWERVRELFESDANGTTLRGYAAAADRFDHEYDVATVRETGGVYFYDADAGYWVRKGQTFIGELLEQHLPDHLNESRKRNIREKVIERNYIASADFIPPEGKLNVENGVLDLDTRELVDHSPDAGYFTSQVRAEWPEDGEPDPWAEAWWLRALADATDLPAERRKIEEFIGYICEPWHATREKIMLFVGPPQSGKSTIQESIEALFGDPPTVSNLTPQQIADTQFDAARLREAQLNTVNDINATKIEDTGTLKRVWSGERTKMENKYEDADFAAPTTKHLFTANWVPRLVGQDESVYRRMLLVEFVKSIPDSQKDRGYKARLKRASIRQAILVRALDARDRLNDQDGFTNDRPRSDTRELYSSWRDAHRRYLYTQFEVTMDPDDTVDRAAYNLGLQEFCGRQDFAPVSRSSVTKTLQYVPGVYASGSGDTYGGLRWRDRDAGDPSDSSFASLSQFERRENVLEWVRELAGEQGAAHDDVLAKAEKAGVHPDTTGHDIEKMLSRGDIYEVETRMYRPVN